MERLLCIAQSFAPETTPTAIRSSKLLARLSARWRITVLTEATQSAVEDGEEDALQIKVIPSRRPRRAFALIRRLRLNKLLELLVWPDQSIFWVIPAIRAGRRAIAQERPQAIVVFMMPYAAGLVGVALKRLTGVPLVINLDDSLTCTDMHPHFPTRLHFRLARWLEDFYVSRADEVIYVSQRNLETVRDRQQPRDREKLHLVRYGADSSDFTPSLEAASGAGFEIAYVGAMSGWWTLIGAEQPRGAFKPLYAAWTRLGRYERLELDQRSSSPAFIGRAVLEVLDEHPDWEDRLRVMLYGNPYDPAVVARALESTGVQSVVGVREPVPHAQVAQIIARADLLLITLPKRVDGSPGGRISAKTYEYLMTDRPILAAVPPGENWDFLADKPGVWLVEPDDHAAMTEIVAELAAAKFAGQARTFDRSELRDELSYDARAEEFARVIEAAA